MEFRRKFQILPACLALLFAASVHAQPATMPVGPDQPAAEMRVVAPEVVPPPKPIFDPRTYGAKGDGVTYDTAALQKAIDACGGTGGTVYLAGGKFLSAELTLKGKMTFYVERDAALIGGEPLTDYPELVPAQFLAQANRRSLLYADHADGLILDGPGVIDGQGKLYKTKGKEPTRPSLLRIFHSNDVIVRNITLKDPRMWTEVYSECNNLLVDHITVAAPSGYNINLDGIDVCDCHDVVVRNCNIDSDDDGICLKTDGPPGLKNVLIENNVIRSQGANGIKFGTATIGPISNIRILNNTVWGARYGGLCIESVDGSVVSDITVHGLDLYNVCQPIFIRVGHRVEGPGEFPKGGTPQVVPQGSIDGVTLERVRALGTHAITRASCSITGIPGAPVKNVTLTDCYFEMPGGIDKIPPAPAEHPGDYPQSNLFGDTPAWGFYVRHAQGIVLDHITIGRHHPDARPWFVTEDADVKTSDVSVLNEITPAAVPSESSIRKTDHP